jgi:hypothetical protein
MYLVVTIDTEEDNWARYSATDNPVANIEELIPLQKLFDRYGVKPTYLISYPVATHQRSVAILKGFLDQGKCEMGMHCHPWNTPPFDPTVPITERDTMLCNLDPRIQSEKLAALHSAILHGFGTAPVSFRAGRWGIGPATVEALSALGVRVDSSVTPYTSWQAYQGPDHSAFGPELFWLRAGNAPESDPLLEIPASVGFLQSNFARCHKIATFTHHPVLRNIHLPGILQRLGVLNKLWLSPEYTDAVSMIALARRLHKNGYPLLNLTFHSTSLRTGASPFVKNDQQKQEFIMRIEEFLRFARDAEVEPITLAQVKEKINHCVTHHFGVRWLGEAAPTE